MESIQAAIDFNTYEIELLTETIKDLESSFNVNKATKIDECLQFIRFYQINIEALKQAQLKLN